MSDTDLTQYGQAFAELLAEPRTMVLDQGSANSAARPALESLSIDKAFDGQRVTNRDMAAACVSGVWLYHDFHDRSHTFSQDIDTTTGSFWHGIMHRREPDYWNSKYWFRKVGTHAIFGDLAVAANEEAQAAGLANVIAPLTVGGRWDAAGFVDLCEQAATEGGDLESLCQQIQWREWWLLFDYSYQNAIR
jgi:hypothetical protein